MEFDANMMKFDTDLMKFGGADLMEFGGVDLMEFDVDLIEFESLLNQRLIRLIHRLSLILI